MRHLILPAETTIDDPRELPILAVAVRALFLIRQGRLLFRLPVGQLLAVVCVSSATQHCLSRVQRSGAAYRH